MNGSRWFGAVAMTAALLLSTVAVVRAHEGHTHTVLGTVSKVAEGQFELKTPEGKVETILTTPKTVVTKGKDAAALKDVTVGQRVAVDVGAGQAPLTARGIKLGVTAAAAAKPAGHPAPKS